MPTCWTARWKWRSASRWSLPTPSTYEQMGFLNAMRFHRANDTLVIGAAGIPEKDKFFELIAEGDMKGFLELRDGPFKLTPR